MEGCKVKGKTLCLLPIYLSPQNGYNLSKLEAKEIAIPKSTPLSKANIGLKMKCFD